MAVYKVPQDVEADDKLLGPFSFRQFIYLLIVAIGIAILFFLFRANVTAGFIALIPILPVILLFGAIALPLKKDQPMETYLLAIVRFNMKPRMRIWNPEGSMNLVTITAPKVMEAIRTKGLSGTEAESRLSYLANVMDTRGWASKGVNPTVAAIAAPPPIPISDDTQDVLDSSADVAQSFEKLIAENDNRRRQEVMERMKNPVTTSQAQDDEALSYNPYPAAIHQRIVSPLGQQPAGANKSVVAPPQPVKPSTDAEPAKPTGDKQPDDEQQSQASPEQLSPDIMRLAENKDLSISAIANEAHRLQEKADSDEVVISLR
jgi:hypothetical protein